jgi:hypothetical protein
MIASQLNVIKITTVLFLILNCTTTFSQINKTKKTLEMVCREDSIGAKRNYEKIKDKRTTSKRKKIILMHDYINAYLLSIKCKDVDNVQCDCKLLVSELENMTSNYSTLSKRKKRRFNKKYNYEIFMQESSPKVNECTPKDDSLVFSKSQENICEKYKNVKVGRLKGQGFVSTNTLVVLDSKILKEVEIGSEFWLSDNSICVKYKLLSPNKAIRVSESDKCPVNYKIRFNYDKVSSSSACYNATTVMVTSSINSNNLVDQSELIGIELNSSKLNNTEEFWLSDGTSSAKYKKNGDKFIQMSKVEKCSSIPKDKYFDSADEARKTLGNEIIEQNDLLNSIAGDSYNVNITCNINGHEAELTLGIEADTTKDNKLGEYCDLILDDLVRQFFISTALKSQVGFDDMNVVIYGKSDATPIDKTEPPKYLGEFGIPTPIKAYVIKDMAKNAQPQYFEFIENQIITNLELAFLRAYNVYFIMNKVLDSRDIQRGYKIYAKEYKDHYQIGPEYRSIKVVVLLSNIRMKT